MAARSTRTARVTSTATPRRAPIYNAIFKAVAVFQRRMQLAYFERLTSPLYPGTNETPTPHAENQQLSQRQQPQIRP